MEESPRKQQQQQQQQPLNQPVKVCLRIRPSNSYELSQGAPDGVRLLSEDTVETSHLVEGGRKVDCHRHTYDAVHTGDASQTDIFNQSGIAELCASAIHGYHATVFAYGQTGSGKTYTMLGPPDGTLTGIIPQSAAYIFDTVDTINRNLRSDPTSAGVGVKVQASFLEIHNETVYDLLSGSEQSLPLRWSQGTQSFFAENAMVVDCDALDDLIAVVEEGVVNRKSASHLLNADSSRSHSVLTVHFESNMPAPFPKKPTQVSTYGKINFVDLAGSERLKESKSAGGNLVETCHINKSLLALAQVISVLAEQSASQSPPNSGAQVSSPLNASVGGGGHVPYRDSKLTKLLMDSLGGACKTLMVACVSPASMHVDETRNTLMYATRARSITTSPVIRIGSKQNAIQEMKSELERLRRENRALRETQQNQQPNPPGRAGSFASTASPVSTPDNFVSRTKSAVAESRRSLEQNPAPQLHGGSSIRLGQGNLEEGHSMQKRRVVPTQPAVGMDHFDNRAESASSSSQALSSDVEDLITRLQLDNERLKVENTGLKKKVRALSSVAVAGLSPKQAGGFGSDGWSQQSPFPPLAALPGPPPEVKPTGVLELADPKGKRPAKLLPLQPVPPQLTSPAAATPLADCPLALGVSLPDAVCSGACQGQSSLEGVVRLLKGTLSRLSIEADALRQKGCGPQNPAEGIAAVVAENIRLVEVLRAFDVLQGGGDQAFATPRSPVGVCSQARLAEALARVAELEASVEAVQEELDRVTVAPAPPDRQHIVDRRELRLQRSTNSALRLEISKLRESVSMQASLRQSLSVG